MCGIRGGKDDLIAAVWIVVIKNMIWVTLLQVVQLIVLLATLWDARGDPPGQITTGAVIHFGEDAASQYAKVM